jgi:hypothetical protein
MEGMMRVKVIARTIVLVAALALTTAVAVGADVLSGTWKLNVAKSKFSPGPAPKSGTQTITATADGMKVVADGVDSEGKKTRNEYSAKFDGKEYPEKPTIDGKPNSNGPDTISIKKIDDYNFETTTRKKGAVLTVTKIVISKDGKTLTATGTGKNAEGKTVNNSIVAEKQ